jgi:hypothetical protein
MEFKFHSGDVLLNIITQEYWKIVLVDEEHNQLIISCEPYGMRVVNIKGLDIDYILPNGE